MPVWLSVIALGARDLLTQSGLAAGLAPALMSVAGILFAVRAFLVVHLVERVLGTEEFATQFRDQVALGRTGSQFDLVTRRANLFDAAGLSCLLTSVLLIIANAFPSPWVALVCLAGLLCTVTLCLLVGVRFRKDTKDIVKWMNARARRETAKRQRLQSSKVNAGLRKLAAQGRAPTSPD